MYSKSDFKAGDWSLSPGTDVACILFNIPAFFAFVPHEQIFTLVFEDLCLFWLCIPLINVSSFLPVVQRIVLKACQLLESAIASKLFNFSQHTVHNLLRFHCVQNCGNVSLCEPAPA